MRNPTTHWNRAWLLLLVGLCLPAVAQPGIEHLRITEVSPSTNEVEVTNTGGAALTLTSNLHFCHRFNYSSVIPNGTSFDPGERKVFTVSSLDNDDSDLWLYADTNFTNPASMIHGVKYGPAPNVGRMPEATTAGLWPGTTVFAPAPAAGQTLVWDGVGFQPADWYVSDNPALGATHTTPAGSVPNALDWPSGEQDFEDMDLGDDVTAIAGWPVVSDATSGHFSVRAVNDVLGVQGPRPGSGSTQWLRIRDTAASGQNRFYSATVTAPAEPTGYTWTFHVNLEVTPPGLGDDKPRFTIQHTDGGFANAWGVEFSDAGAALIVTGIGGTADSVALYPLGGATDLGQWVRIDLTVDFAASTVSASFNGGGTVSLPIDPAPTVDKDVFRFCYRGEGTGNVMTMLVDDISLAALVGTPTSVIVYRLY